MSYLGNEPLLGLNNRDRFTGTGSQTVFTLSRVPAQAEGVLVMVSGVVQDSLTYSCAAKTLTFTEAPPAPFPGSGIYNIEVVFLGKQGSPYTANWNIPIADNSGTADAIAASFNPAITTLTDNLVVRVVLSAANTVTNPTFNPNGLGALNILGHTGSALLVGELSGTIDLRYESSTTSWRAISSSVEVFPTPAQFSNSILGATTEFVQRALGNYQDAIVLTTNTTLTALDYGKVFFIDATSGNKTITLPTPPAQGGCAVKIYKADSTANTVAVTTPSGSIIGTNNFNGGTSSTTVTLRQVGDFLDLCSQSGSYYGLSGGGGALISPTGYQKLPSGLLIQWGSITNTGATDTVNFALTFPTVVYCVTTSQSNGAGQMPLSVISAITSSNFTLKSYIGAPGAVMNAATASQNTCYYIAIGK